MTDLLATLPVKKVASITKVKTKEDYKEIGPFNVWLPSVAMLFKRSPTTNLLLSPTVNVGKATPSSYSKPSATASQPFRDLLYERGNRSFASRKMILFSYKVTNSRSGMALTSIVQGPIEDQNKKTKQNCTERIPHSTAININRNNFELFMTLFDREVDSREDAYNFDTLFRSDSSLSTYKSLVTFLNEYKLPHNLIN